MDLLGRADDSVELAVTLHFNTASTSGAGASSSTSQLDLLKALTGDQATEVQLLQLLNQHGSVERAANAFFAQQSDNGGTQPSAAVATSSQAATAGDVITLSSDREASSGEEDLDDLNDPDDAWQSTRARLDASLAELQRTLPLPEAPTSIAAAHDPGPIPQTSSFGR